MCCRCMICRCFIWLWVSNWRTRLTWRAARRAIVLSCETTIELIFLSYKCLWMKIKCVWMSNMSMSLWCVVMMVDGLVYRKKMKNIWIIKLRASTIRSKKRFRSSWRMRNYLNKNLLEFSWSVCVSVKLKLSEWWCFLNLRWRNVVWLWWFVFACSCLIIRFILGWMFFVCGFLVCGILFSNV